MYDNLCSTYIILEFVSYYYLKERERERDRMRGRERESKTLSYIFAYIDQELRERTRDDKLQHPENSV